MMMNYTAAKQKLQYPMKKIISAALTKVHALLYR